MKNIVLFTMLVCLSTTFINAQWLETTVMVGITPHRLCWNSTDNKVYCANFGSGDVTVIDGVTNSVITTIAVGNLPNALCWNATNNKI